MNVHLPSRTLMPEHTEDSLQNSQHLCRGTLGSTPSRASPVSATSLQSALYTSHAGGGGAGDGEGEGGGGVGVGGAGDGDGGGGRGGEGGGGGGVSSETISGSRFGLT